MKIAFLIYAHANPNHLLRLIQAITSPNHDIYLHIDAKSSLEKFEVPKNLNVHLLNEREDVSWGGFSQVEVTLRLIQAAMETSKYDYFVLMSGSDYPIRSNKILGSFLEKNNGKEFINFCEMPQNGKSLSRVEDYYFEMKEKDSFAFKHSKRILNFFCKIIPFKRKLPQEFSHFILYGGSSWWTLTYDAIEHITQFLKKYPTYLKFYKHTLCPDEMFFQTILGNSRFRDTLQPSLHYSLFPQGAAHPIKLKEEHVKILKNDYEHTSYGEARILFARKFDNSSEKVVQLIDQKLRK